MKKAGSLLESDYISQLNKEKEELNLEIARDSAKQGGPQISAAKLHKSETLY
jgi:hypothetical protein